jgi:hypothetical protein
MSGKRICLAGLVVVFLGLGVAHAQSPTYSPGSPMLPSYSSDAGSSASNGAAPGQGATGGPTDMGTAGPNAAGAGPVNATAPISSWLAYPRSPGCCGPIGGCGPIGSEVFIRLGISYPFGGSVIDHSLRDGWDVDGGVRSLFFDLDRQSAWTVSLGVSNIYSQGQANPPTVTLNNVKVGIGIPTGQSASTAQSQAAQAVQALGLPPSVASQLTSNIQTTTGVVLVLPAVNASVADYNQTFVNLAGGRMWYLRGSADCSNQGCSWRVGCEGGGRWGTAKADFNEIRHRTDVIGGLFTAVYSDVEYPWHSCAVLQAGLRVEYQYIWGDILQDQNTSDYQSVILMITAGLRF